MRMKEEQIPAAIGKTRWAIAEGYIPEWSSGPEPEMLSHETLCILNASETEARVTITLYFSNRDPAGPYHFAVLPRRTRHLRLNDFHDPELPRGTDMASVIESNVPIVVQHTRLDTRQPANATMTTVAYGA